MVIPDKCDGRVGTEKLGQSDTKRTASTSVVLANKPYIHIERRVEHFDDMEHSVISSTRVITNADRDKRHRRKVSNWMNYHNTPPLDQLSSDSEEFYILSRVAQELVTASIFLTECMMVTDLCKRNITLTSFILYK